MLFSAATFRFRFAPAASGWVKLGIGAVLGIGTRGGYGGGRPPYAVTWGQSMGEVTIPYHRPATSRGHVVVREQTTNRTPEGATD